MRFLLHEPPKGLQKSKRILSHLKIIFNQALLKPGQTIVFKSKTPFRQPDTSRIKLYEVVQTTRQKVPYSFVKDSTNSCRYFLKTKLAEKKKYLFIADSAVIWQYL